MGKMKIGLCMLLLLLVVGVLPCVAKSYERDYDENGEEGFKVTLPRISGLIEEIVDRLSGKESLALFMEEQRLWESFAYRHFETIYPERIDGVEMHWGSSINLKTISIERDMNLKRIKVLERYMGDYSQSAIDSYTPQNIINNELTKSTARILELEKFIIKNIQGTTVYDLFMSETKTWNEYAQAHFRTVRSGALINAKQIDVEQLQINLERIFWLEEFIKGNDGTDGKGEFKEGVAEEIRMLKEEAEQ